MSFRIEQKLDINTQNLTDFKNWIYQNDAKKIFEDRKVISIYFDNASLGMHHEGEEGVVPRKKIRVRYYGTMDAARNIYFLEKKISSAEGRFKTSKKIDNLNKFLNEGIFDNNYGICKPVVKIEYLRSYYKIFDTRMTIDTNITYSKLNSLLKKKDDSIIVELKSNNLKILEHLNSKFPFSRLRFSKYSRAVLKTLIT